jgi:hypothetical protein
MLTAIQSPQDQIEELNAMKKLYTDADLICTSLDDAIEAFEALRYHSKQLITRLEDLRDSKHLGSRWDSDSVVYQVLFSERVTKQRKQLEGDLKKVKTAMEKLAEDTDTNHQAAVKRLANSMGTNHNVVQERAHALELKILKINQNHYSRSLRRDSEYTGGSL